MKKLFIGLFALVICFSLARCVFVSNDGSEYMKVVKLYYNDYDIDTDNSIKKSRVMVVYEIDNTTDENWEDSFFFGGGVNTLTIGSNDYEYDYELTKNLGSSYGFKIPGADKEVWAGAKYRYVAGFIVNSNDIKEDMEAEFKVNYNKMTYTYNFKYDDLTLYTIDEMNNMANLSKVA